MAAFRQERSRRADMLAMDTNKLVIRLEKLMTSLPVEPIKRRAHEQAVVPWVPEDVVKLCPNCAKSFNLTRLVHILCRTKDISAALFFNHFAATNVTGFSETSSLAEIS